MLYYHPSSSCFLHRDGHWLVDGVSTRKGCSSTYIQSTLTGRRRNISYIAITILNALSIHRQPPRFMDSMATRRRRPRQRPTMMTTEDGGRQCNNNIMWIYSPTVEVACEWEHAPCSRQVSLIGWYRATSAAVAAAEGSPRPCSTDRVQYLPACLALHAQFNFNLNASLERCYYDADLKFSVCETYNYTAVQEVRDDTQSVLKFVGLL